MAPPASVFAGLSAVALGLAGLLLPAHHATVTPAAAPCTQAAPGSAAGGYTLCLSVVQVTKASKLLPGHDADFTIQVWLADQPASPPPSPPADTASPADSGTPSPAASTPAPSPGPSAANVTVTLTAPAGGPLPRFLSCPAAVSNGTCPLGTVTDGPPASTLAADIAIPATATASQTVTFTITTATDTAGVGQPAATQSFTVAAPAVPASPATSPASTPAATGTSPTPAAGATLPAGLGTPAPLAPVPALGPLPGPAATGPAAVFPVVTPAPGQAPATASSGRMPLTTISEQFPLVGSQLGIRFGGLALAAALTCLGTAWVTVRRRPGPGSGSARTPPTGGRRP